MDWEAFFGTLGEINFDGIMTSQVFAWDGERAVQSSRFMLGKMQEYVEKYWKQS